MSGAAAASAAQAQGKAAEGQDAEVFERPKAWAPSGNRWRDLLYFVGPGWMVCIAYVDPGNYQANINAGATTGYRLLWTIWWMSVLSMYCQILCVRLSMYAQVTLSEAQAMNLPRWLRYLNWFIAEFSAVITDIPEVIGIGIALNVFFGWPYVAGVLLSLLTTLGFLALQRFGMQPLEAVICTLVGVMGITIWVESALTGYDSSKYLAGWAYGFVETKSTDLWAIIGILGAVVMPHNLYLHSASCRTRTVQRTPDVVRKAVAFMSWEPALPIFVTFFISAATVVIAAQRIYGKPGADDAGLTDFYDYVTSVRGSRWLWGLSLLAAGQSSAITTTYAGQYVMDGFLKIRLPMWKRALLTRMVAIAPCVAVAVAMNGPALNQAVNIVNGSLAWLLPFALTPLVKFTTSRRFMGEYAAGPVEGVCAWSLAFAVYAVNAVCLSCPGGGFFGDLLFGSGAAVQMGPTWVLLCVVMVGLQVFSLAWNAYIALMPIRCEMPALETQRELETEFTVARAVLAAGNQEAECP